MTIKHKIEKAEEISACTSNNYSVLSWYLRALCEIKDSEEYLTVFDTDYEINNAINIVKKNIEERF